MTKLSIISIAGSVMCLLYLVVYQIPFNYFMMTVWAKSDTCTWASVTTKSQSYIIPYMQYGGFTALTRSLPTPGNDFSLQLCDRPGPVAIEKIDLAYGRHTITILPEQLRSWKCENCVFYIDADTNLMMMSPYGGARLSTDHFATYLDELHVPSSQMFEWARNAVFILLLGFMFLPVVGFLYYEPRAVTRALAVAVILYSIFTFIAFTQPQLFAGWFGPAVIDESLVIGRAQFFGTSLIGDSVLVLGPALIIGPTLFLLSRGWHRTKKKV